MRSLKEPSSNFPKLPELEEPLPLLSWLELNLAPLKAYPFHELLSLAPESPEAHTLPLVAKHSDTLHLVAKNGGFRQE